MDSSQAGYVGSLYSRLMGSCLGCLSIRSVEQSSRVGKNHPVEREMKICHNQPHLVPPMKLVFYDDLPSPASQRPSSHISQWAIEGKNLASRASGRVSTSIRKRSSSRRPQISHPSDFRRVDPPRGRLEPFRPLELSIYLPGNRLSPLYGFEDFDVDDPNYIQAPERALTRSRSDTLLSHTPSFRIARKPVSSMVSDAEMSWSRNNSVRRPTVDLNDRYTQSRPSFCESFVSEAVTVNTEGSLMMKPPQRPQNQLPWTNQPEPATRYRSINNQDIKPRANLSEPFHDAFSPILEESVDGEAVVRTPAIPMPMLMEDPTTPSTLHLPIQLPTTPPTPPAKNSPSSSSSPTHKRVTQWLLRQPTESQPNPATPFYQCSPSMPTTATHTRQQTSISTVSSMISGGAPTVSSLTTRPFTPSTRTEKDEERGLFPLRSHHEIEALPPLPPSYEDVCPPVDGEYEVKDAAHRQDAMLRMSAVGVAF